MSFVLITPPVGYPVTLAEAKATCRVDGTSDDAVLEILIAAATGHVEQYTGRAILPQTWALYQDSFPDAFMLARGPAISVTSIEYYDTDEVLQTVSAADYTVDTGSDPAWVVPNADFTWPTVADGVNNVILTYQAGYATTPDPIKWAILLLVSQWFDNRADANERALSEVPNGVAALLTNFRSFAF